MEAGPYMDTSTEAIRDSLRRLAEARHHAPPVARATCVDLRQTTAQEEERIRYYMQYAVFTVFYGSSPQLSQFQEAIDMSWKGGGVSIKERASPVIKGTPSVTLPWISEMEATTYEPPIKPTWVELPELPIFDKEVIQQLLSGIGPVVRLPYVTQHLKLPSARALVLWDIRMPLVQELIYTYDEVEFRQPVRFIHLGTACETCGLGTAECCTCSASSSTSQVSSLLPLRPPGSTFVRLLEEQLEAGIQSTRVEFMDTDQPGGGHQIPSTTQ
ncbi:hypothetical protein R1sor_000179 [Riccia sorocarpa]|uniref:Uncharacterized protein n=1 Tax=Riccia sorocarpa TaxID=122646 RepID=A0ABD3GSD4_9MARC